MTRTAKEHAAAMDANAYWHQFPITIDWTVEGQTIIGTIEHLGETKHRDEWSPRIHIRQDDGILAIVTAYQTRLLSELVRLAPKVGDRIRIRYLGDNDKTAPGMAPTKQFAVALKPAGTTDQEPGNAP